MLCSLLYSNILISLSKLFICENRDPELFVTNFLEIIGNLKEFWVLMSYYFWIFLKDAFFLPKKQIFIQKIYCTSVDVSYF